MFLNRLLTIVIPCKNEGLTIKKTLSLINQQFFVGNGTNALSQLNGLPITYSIIINAIDASLSTLYQQGLDYSFAGGVLTIYNTTCYNDFMNNTLNLDISLDVVVECS